MHIRDTPLPRSAVVQEFKSPYKLRTTLGLLEPDMQTVALVVSGEGEWWFDGEWHALKSGWMNWRYPEERKRIRTNTRYRTIVFRFRMQRHGKLRLPRFCAWRDAHAACCWAEEQLTKYAKEPVDALQARLWYDRLISEVQAWQDAQADRPELIDVAHQFIAQHASDANFDVAQLSELLLTSERNLFHVFQQHLEKTPLQFIQQERVGQACVLLQQSDESIAAIAESCGFGHPQSFTRVFKQVIGLTPSAWRQAH